MELAREIIYTITREILKYPIAYSLAVVYIILFGFFVYLLWDFYFKRNCQPCTADIVSAEESPGTSNQEMQILSVSLPPISFSKSWVESEQFGQAERGPCETSSGTSMSGVVTVVSPRRKSERLAQKKGTPENRIENSSDRRLNQSPQLVSSHDTPDRPSPAQRRESRRPKKTDSKEKDD